MLAEFVINMLLLILRVLLCDAYITPPKLALFPSKWQLSKKRVERVTNNAPPTVVEQNDSGLLVGSE